MPDAITKLSDLVNPEILADMIAEQLADAIPELPGVYSTDEFSIGEKGSLWTIPYDKPLGDFEVMVEDNDLTIQKLQQDKFRMVVNRRGAAYGEFDIAKLAAAADPMRDISTKITEKIQELLLVQVIYILEGAIPDANRKDASSGTATKTAIRSGIAKLGDKATSLRFSVMHSKVFEDLNNADHVTWQRRDTVLPLMSTQTNLLGVQQVGDLIPTVAGTIIIVTDKCTKIVGTPTTYATYVLGNNALGFFWQRQVNIDTDRDVLGKYDVIVPDINFVLSLLGVDYGSESYTDANLINTSNYTLKWNQKLIKAVRILTK